eukprot:jgi/Astpho2/3101/Aster-x1120
MGKRDKRKPKQSPSKGDQEFTDQPAQHGFWLPGHGGQADASEPPNDAVGEAPQQLDVLELYQQAVQSPAGDISYLLRFFRDLVGPQVPLHLREDFCGSALISAMWCKADVRRSAVGIDLDRRSLMWGWEHNSIALLGSGADRLCLLHANVRADLIQYFCRVHAALDHEAGSIFVMDLLGGHAAESVSKLWRVNEQTGLAYFWEQVRFDPIHRRLTCELTLRDPSTGKMLEEAGFATQNMHIWARPINEKSDADGGTHEEEFMDFAELGNGPQLHALAKGWTAYIIVKPLVLLTGGGDCTLQQWQQQAQSLNVADKLKPAIGQQPQLLALHTGYGKRHCLQQQRVQDAPLPGPAATRTASFTGVGGRLCDVEVQIRGARVVG